MAGMKLSEKQRIFGRNISLLLAKIFEMGLEYTWGEAYRPPEMAEIYAANGAGIINSVHRSRLGIDLFLWKNGKIIWDGPEYGYLAVFWLGLNPLNRWGGRFRPRKDVYHYSMEHNGVM
jgi:hypothetical protein